MEKTEMEKGSSPDEASHLTRNRSFKSKQLVRSQAIRESTSPPRTVSPAVTPDVNVKNIANTQTNIAIEKNGSENFNNKDVKPFNNVKNDRISSDVKNERISGDVRNNKTFTDVRNDKINDSKSDRISGDVRNDKTYIDVKNERISGDVRNDKSYGDVPNIDVRNNRNIGDVQNERTFIGDKDRTLKSDASSHSDDRFSESNSCSVSEDDCKRKQPVEIQITSGGWDTESQDQRQRTKRWLGQRTHSSSRDLLSNNPRVACVCGACTSTPHCRGCRRKRLCQAKQDSGIVCSDDCPDCSDSETGANPKKDSIEDKDDQTMYCRCPERKEKPKSISLSRTDSADDKSELSGVELVAFIKETLNKNARDRATMLKIEKELHALVNDTGRCIVRFPVMTSYGRMLVHRCAALFQLSHHLDQVNKSSVTVSKSGTSGGRIPCTQFKDWCTTIFPTSPQPMRHDFTNAKSILKRATNSLEEAGSGEMFAARSKSLEQREREYERVRRRIFSSDNCNQDESQWPWLNSGPVKLLTPEGARNKLLKVQSLEGSNPTSSRGRGAVAKAHSFGGYAGEESRPAPRLLSRQGDLASSSWRLSPSSSGYRTLSLHSTDSVTPSPTGGASPEPTAATGDVVVWAITDLSAVPKGAIVLHPQTGRPLTNPDGSVYHFEPTNPPPLYNININNNNSFEGDTVDQNNEKRRGRLEKQHSFIDTECECQPSEQSKKCCCECRHGHEKGARSGHTETVQAPPQSDQKPTQKQPTSPCKTRYQEPEATNTNLSQEYSTNKNQAQENSTNPKPPQQFSTNHGQPQDYSTNSNQVQDYTTNHNQQQIYATNHSQEYTIIHQTQQHSTNHNQAQIYSTNHTQAQEYSTNHRPYTAPTPEKSETTNQRQVYENYSPNQRVGFEPRTLEPANQQPRFENRTVEPANQRGESTNHRKDQEVHYVQTFQHQQPVYSHEEQVTSPAQMQAVQYAPQEMTLQAKTTPIAMPDPNIRPVSLTNVMYPTAMPQQYQYLNQCRVDQHLQPMYQPIPVEEQKLPPSTFRIDPSYPYSVAVDYCGGCDQTQHPHGNQRLQHPRSNYNVSYTPVEMTSAVPQYPVGNMILPQPVQPYPYQEHLQWPTMQPLIAGTQPKLLLQDLYQPVPFTQPMYPPYTVLYPQMIPQPYPMVQPVFPLVDNKQPTPNLSGPRHSKRNSVSGSSRATPLQTPPEDKKVPYDDNNQQHHQIQQQHQNQQLTRQQSDNAASLQHIQQEVSRLSVRGEKREWRRRNSGQGLLGCYPAPHTAPHPATPGGYTGGGNRMPRPANDETHLNAEARSILNSIRSLPPKSNSFQERKPEFHNQQRADKDRFNRRDEKSHKRPDDRDRRVFLPPYLVRQMSPGTWCRRSPAPVQHPVLNPPRRPHPDKNRRT